MWMWTRIGMVLRLRWSPQVTWQTSSFHPKTKKYVAKATKTLRELYCSLIPSLHSRFFLAMCHNWRTSMSRLSEKVYNKKQVWYSYLKTSQVFNVPIHSRALLAAILHWLIATLFWRLRSQSASHCHVYVASASQYPSWTCNCARLLTVATQSSRLTCWSQLE